MGYLHFSYFCIWFSEHLEQAIENFRQEDEHVNVRDCIKCAHLEENMCMYDSMKLCNNLPHMYFPNWTNLMNKSSWKIKTTYDK